MAAEVTSRYAVLGGGISGLSAAYFLAKRHTDPRKITVIEASPRVGGWMHSVRSDDGAIFEQGPRSLRPSGPAGWASLKLASELNLDKKIISIPSSHVGAKNRFIYSKGKVHRLPNSLFSFVQKQSLFSKSLLPTILKEPFAKKPDTTDESVYDFICRRFNNELAEYMVDPMCRGIFAGDARLLSLKSALSPAYAMEQSHGSIVKAALLPGKSAQSDPNPLVQRSIKEKWSIWSLQGGLQTLADTIYSALLDMGVKVLLKTPCNDIKFLQDGTVAIQSESQQFIYDHLICSLSACRASPMLKDSHPELTKDLDSISSVSVGLVNLEYKRNVIKDGGFGILVPSSEPVKVLGVIYDSCVFPQHDGRPETSRLTVMMGGHWFKDHLGDPNTIKADNLTNTALDGISQILGIQQDPLRTLATVQTNCISQYTIGHSDRIERIYRYIHENNLPLSLIGASYKGVSVNDCVLNAQKAVDGL